MELPKKKPGPKAKAPAPDREAFRQRLLAYLYHHRLLGPLWKEWAQQTGVSEVAFRHYVSGIKPPTERVEQALRQLFPDL